MIALGIVNGESDTILNPAGTATRAMGAVIMYNALAALDRLPA